MNQEEDKWIHVWVLMCLFYFFYWHIYFDFFIVIEFGFFPFQIS